MELNISALNSEEQKTRKQWRYCLFAYCLYTLCLRLGFELFDEGFQDPAMLGATMVDCLFAWIPSFILYRYAYKKAGTRLLSFYMFLFPLHFAAIIVLLIKLPLSIWTSPILVLLFLVGAIWILSKKLKPINKKLQLTADYPKEYMLRREALKQAASDEERKLAYGALVREWPRYSHQSTTFYQSL